MNILFNHFNLPIFKPVVVELIKKFNVEKCWNIAAPQGLIQQSEVPAGTTITSFDYWDLYYCLYGNVDWDNIIPLDEEIVIAMSDLEAEVLFMMDRDVPVYHDHIPVRTAREIEYDPNILNDKINKYHTENLDYDERRDVYLRHIRFWNDFFTKNPVDFVLSLYVPHLTFEFIMYGVAKKLGVPVIMAEHTPVQDNRVFFYDYKENDLNVLYKFQELQEKYKESKIDDIELTGNFLKEWKRVVLNEKAQTEPWYVNTLPKSNVELMNSRKKQFYKPKSKLLSRLCDPDYWHLRLKKLNHSTYMKDKLFGFYEKHCQEPDFTEKYIYAPFHFMPEVTSAPMGGVFADQILMVQMLSACLPEGYWIYVKENPRQKTRCRNHKFYLRLLAVPKVKMISRKISTFELSKNCIAVATLTGTAGWEGLFKGKPFLMFGYFITQFVPGVLPVRTYKQCQESIYKIIHDKVKPELKDLRIFIKTLELAGEVCWTDHLEGSISNLPIDQNCQTIFNAFSKKIESFVQDQKIVTHQMT